MVIIRVHVTAEYAVPADSRLVVSKANVATDVVVNDARGLAGGDRLLNRSESSWPIICANTPDPTAPLRIEGDRLDREETQHL
ncbi:hypothetical protein AB0H00_12925 [Nocardia sp. NPDC023852]|uniref:hypothetical protein n=1 Tax=Nocardia sp. NPDC023852 TaxID=3154697 RepID=UPI0033F353A7